MGPRTRTSPSSSGPAGVPSSATMRTSAPATGRPSVLASCSSVSWGEPLAIIGTSVIP